VALSAPPFPPHTPTHPQPTPAPPRHNRAAPQLQELLALPVEQAEALASKYIDLWGFKNTYAMGKHLAEKAVARIRDECDLPLVIVRPSLVSGVAAEPYAGYSGNFAGQVGGALAYLVGLYNDQPEAVASNGASVWDVVPGDVVAHATIAAAAAAASAASRERIVAPLRGPPPCKGGRQDDQPLMVVQVSSSTTYPLTMAAMFNNGGAAGRGPSVGSVGLGGWRAFPLLQAGSQAAAAAPAPLVGTHLTPLHLTPHTHTPTHPPAPSPPNAFRAQSCGAPRTAAPSPWPSRVPRA